MMRENLTAEIKERYMPLSISERTERIPEGKKKNRLPTIHW